MDKKASLSERSEFRSFPIFCHAQLGTRRAVAAWSPFFAYFGEAKKVSGCRATPDLQASIQTETALRLSAISLTRTQ